MNHEFHVGSSLPPGWDAFSLGSKASFVTSGSRGWARFYSESGDLFLRSQNIRSGHLDLEDRQHVLPPAGAEGERTRVQPNDLLVTITGNSVGNVAISSDDLGIAYISQHVGMIRLVNPSLAPYACWYLSPGAPGNRQIMDAQTGQSKPGLNLQNLKGLVVAVPKDKRERDLIVAALDDIQAQADEMQILLSKKRMLKQAAMQELLTGKRRLPGFEGEWEVKRLGELGEFLKGSGVKKDEAASGELPCVRYGEIYTHHDNYISEFSSRISETVAASATAIRQGDILFAGSGETKEEIGKSVALTHPVKAFAGGDIVIMRQNAVDTLFLGYRLNALDVSRQKAGFGQGDAVVHISARALSKISVSVPGRTEQEAIAGILYEMDAELRQLQERLSKTQSLKQGMMQQLLTGKIRLT